jgi:hypothetical protein
MAVLTRDVGSHRTVNLATFSYATGVTIDLDSIGAHQ